jgi:DNA repair protein RadD
MGCGKTIISVSLIEKLYNENNDLNFLILMHKQELITQFHHSFNKFTEFKEDNIGTCCSSLFKNHTYRNITIASVQSLVNNLESLPKIDLIIIDECHRVNISYDSQYKQVIDYIRNVNRKAKILGITATPFRLDHGYIYGDNCAKNSKNLFSELKHSIGYKELMDLGYLVPLKGKVVLDSSLKKDLANVPINGDYGIGQLGDVMSIDVHLQTAVEAINKYASPYKCICVFCCTIKHAELLHELLPDVSVLIHSQLTPLEREINLKKWTSGNIRIAISINILMEGFDLPRLDCIIFARPTLSPVLYLQTIGRVLRLSPEKTHGYIIDLTDNTKRFRTNLDNIQIKIPNNIEQKKLSNSTDFRLCPMCDTECLMSCKVCTSCGFTWPNVEIIAIKELPKLKDVNFDNKIIKQTKGMARILYYEIYESKKTSKLLGKICFEFKSQNKNISTINKFLCFNDYYRGYAVKRSKMFWNEMFKDIKFPKNVTEFIECVFEDLTYNATVNLKGLYPEIEKIELIN